MSGLPSPGVPGGRLLVAIDVDGTLLDSEFEDALRPREVAALLAVRAAGHVVALCTGRNSRSIEGLLRRGDGALADLPLVLLNGADQWTLPLGVMNFSTEYSSDQARVLAYTVVAMIPALIFYALAERHIVSGLTGGSVKG
jgi:hydroxymethylpyrimidine pyrophosphatase-like HAD family hydrolase